MLMAQQQQLYELWCKALLLKGKNIQECSKALEARVAIEEVKTDSSSNENLFPDEKLKAKNRNNPVLDKKGIGTRQSYADTWWLGLSKGDSQPSKLRDNLIKPLTTICLMLSHASVASRKPKVELDSHADTYVFGDNFLHNHNRPVHIYSCNPKDCHKSAKTVDTTISYQDPQNRQKYILIMNQAIQINGLENHILCPMQRCLKGVHITEVPKFLDENPSVTTHAIQSLDPFDPAHPLVIPL